MFSEGMLFLVNTLFDIYLFILIVRVILGYVRSDYFNPITQFVVRMTDFIVKPLRRIIPNFHGVELSSVLLIILLELIKFLLISALTFGLPNIGGLIILAFGDMLAMFIRVFIYAIILQAIISWVQPQSPINYTLYQFTSPIMRPFQRLIPPIGGFDISPIPAIIVLQLLIIILVNPIMELGTRGAFLG